MRCIICIFFWSLLLCIIYFSIAWIQRLSNGLNVIFSTWASKRALAIFVLVPAPNVVGTMEQKVTYTFSVHASLTQTYFWCSRVMCLIARVSRSVKVRFLSALLIYCLRKRAGEAASYLIYVSNAFITKFITTHFHCIRRNCLFF